MVRTWNLFSVPFVLAGLALACQQQAADKPASDETAVDTAAITQAIDAMDKDFAAALVSGDAATLASQYAPDAVLLPPNMPAAKGRQAIQDLFTGMTSATPMTAATITADQVIVSASGDMAVDQGHYTLSGTGPDGSTWDDTGKYVGVWKNMDGQWLMVVDTWNSDLPVPGTEPAEAAE